MDLKSQFLEEGELPLPQVMVSRRKPGSSRSGVWRVCGVLLAVALCAAAAVCFTLNKVTILTYTVNMLFKTHTCVLLCTYCYVSCSF